MSSADELVKLWARTQVRRYVPGESSHLHYRDCPDIEVYTCTGTEYPLSDITPDPRTQFAVTWGCPHSAERMDATLYWHHSLGELIDELSDLENASIPVKQDFAARSVEEDDARDYVPLFAANYPAPGGTVWQPS